MDGYLQDYLQSFIFFFLSSRCTTYRRRHGFRIVCWLDGVIQQVDKENKEQKQETKEKMSNQDKQKGNSEKFHWKKTRWSIREGVILWELQK